MLFRSRQSQVFTATELANEVIDGWMKSPQHRKNLTDPYVTETGIGVAAAPETSQKYISVQLFARPQTYQFQINIKNNTNTPISYTLGRKEMIASPRITLRHSVCEPQMIVLQAHGQL